MKTKAIFCILLFMLALVSITGIYAENVNFDSSSFTLPEGFSVYSTEGDQVALLKDTTSIRVYHNDTHEDYETLKYYRQKLGYNLIGEANYEIDGIKINQQNYTKDNVTVSVREFTKNDKFYMISVSVLKGHNVLDEYDNIVTEIIRSLN